MQRNRIRATPTVLDEDIEFNVWRGRVNQMGGGHAHTDIEINRVQSGAVTYFTSGGYEQLETGDCVVFWAGMPHQVSHVVPGTEMTWAVLPLAWFMQWGLAAEFCDSLLEGHWWRAPEASREVDDAMFGRWVKELASTPGDETTHIVTLEMQAWLRRLARSGGAAERQNAPLQNDATARHIELLARCLARRYREELTIADVAAEARLHPHYAMEVWKRGCGLTLWEYLTKLRLSHAQRLLLSTDWTMDRIADESGFGSRARFYAAFKKHSGTSPRSWRMRQSELR